MYSAVVIGLKWQNAVTTLRMAYRLTWYMIVAGVFFILCFGSCYHTRPRDWLLILFSFLFKSLVSVFSFFGAVPWILFYFLSKKKKLSLVKFEACRLSHIASFFFCWCSTPCDLLSSVSV